MRRLVSSAAAAMRAREAASSACAWALAIAVAASSANAASRCPASGLSCPGRVVAVITTPHSRPPATTGLPVTARMPARRSQSVIDPGAPANRVSRAGRPVRSTDSATPSPSTASRLPVTAGIPVPLQPPSTVAVPSVSYRSTTAMSASDSRASSPATAR